MTVCAGGCAARDNGSADVPHNAGTALTSDSTTPRASTAPDLPRLAVVGALFRLGVSGAHTCTASVIASATGNTVITAAHCVRGDGAAMVFAPSYREGQSRMGNWRVTGAYVLPAWQHRQDPTADFAILTVAPRTIAGRREQLAAVTGSETLGGPPALNSTVTVVAYNHGSNDDPIACRARVFSDDGFPTFDCHGFVAGSSGSPWLTFDAAGHATIHGVIGGLDQGGCHEYRSHSAVFDDGVRMLIHRAETDARPDVVVQPDKPDC